MKTTQAVQARAVRQLYKREPAKRQWQDHEAQLVNLCRKLSADGRLQVYVFAERLAHARVRGRQARADSPFQEFMKRARARG